VCPSGFSFGLASADLSVDVFPGWVVVSLLGDRGDIEDAVDSGPADPLFPISRETPVSRDAVGRLVTRHAVTARSTCPSLNTKNITPHVLRHTCAMQLVHAGIDTSIIALWLGHEIPKTTRIYLHADLALKENALARTTPPNVTPGRFTPPDTVFAFLESL